MVALIVATVAGCSHRRSSMRPVFVRPAPVVVAPQPGATGGRLAGVALRDRWWLFVAAIAAFAGEWAWRRRQGLP